MLNGLAGLFGVMIPIVAVAGWCGYSAVEKWHDVEEKFLAVQAAIRRRSIVDSWLREAGTRSTRRSNRRWSEAP